MMVGQTCTLDLTLALKMILDKKPHIITSSVLQCLIIKDLKILALEQQINDVGLQKWPKIMQEQLLIKLGLKL